MMRHPRAGAGGIPPWQRRIRRDGSVRSKRYHHRWSSRSPGFKLPPEFFLPHFLDETDTFVAKRSSGRVGIVMISGAVAVLWGRGQGSVIVPIVIPRNRNRVFRPPPCKNTTVWPVPVRMSPSSSRCRHVADDVRLSARRTPSQVRAMSE